MTERDFSAGFEMGGHILPHIGELRERTIFIPTETELAKFKEVPSIAIDPETAHEIDDAIWVHKEHGKSMQLTVVIARAGMIPPDSHYVGEALENGWSHYYGNEGYAPMFRDDRLAANVLSLLDGELRPAVAFTCELTRSGQIRNPDIELVKTRTQALSYGQFTEQAKAGEYSAIIQAYNTLRKREGRSGAGPNFFEQNYNGEYNPSEAYGKRVVAEFMLFANEQMGRMMHEHGVPWVFRYFDPKQELELLDVGIENISEQFREYIAYVKRAFYNLEPRDHRELKKDNYSHNTSPLRRAADFINHMILEYVMHGGDPDEIDRDVLQSWIDRLNYLISVRADRLLSEY